MTISELQDAIKSDLKISGDDLSNEAIKTPDIHNKYSKMLFAEKMALKGLERKMDILYLEVWEYYRKKADPEVYEQKPLLKKVLDSDAKIYIAADSRIVELREKIENKQELIEYIKRALDQVSQRTWLIRNAIEYYKFTHGGLSV